jgi:hypothetical protein
VLTGGLSAAQRDQTFKDFTENKIKVRCEVVKAAAIDRFTKSAGHRLVLPRSQVLVATDVMCRGVNIPSIKTVVHYGEFACTAVCALQFACMECPCFQICQCNTVTRTCRTLKPTSTDVAGAQQFEIKQKLHEFRLVKWLTL